MKEHTNSNTEHSIVISKETVITAVNKYQHNLQEADISILPETLQALHNLWHNYPKNADIEAAGTSQEERAILLQTHREDDINNTLNAVQEHLGQLPGIDNKALDILNQNSLFRRTLIKHAKEDDLILSMKEYLFYISLLTKVSPTQADIDKLAALPSEERNEKETSIKTAIEERNSILAQFPTSDPAQYACLEGLRDRQQAPLMELQLPAIPPQARAILNAHNEVVEQPRIRFAPLIPNDNQTHLAPAIEYLYGIGDPTKRHAKPTAMTIPAEKAWKAARNYIAELNSQLEAQYIQTEAERIQNILEIEAIIDKHPLDMAHLTSWVDVGKALEPRGLKPEDISITAEEHPFVTSWDKDKIPALFPAITVENPVTLPLPESLFAPDAPEQLAALLNSDIPANREMGIHALLLMGHEGQLGSSPIQFLKTVHILGEYQDADYKLPQEDMINTGARKLKDLATPENPSFNNKLDTLSKRIIHYQQDKPASPLNMYPYINYLRGGAIPPVVVFFNGNAPASILQEHIQNNPGVIPNSPQSYFSVFHNPERQAILHSLFHSENNSLSPERASKIGRYLTHLGAQYHDMEMIHYIRHGFLSAEEASCTETQKRYPNGAAIVRAGLLSQPNTSSPTGLQYLATHDARMLEGLIGTTPYDGADRISPDILKTYSKNLTIIHALAARGDTINLQRVLSLVPPEEQEALLTQPTNDEHGYTALHLAAQKGHPAVTEFLTANHRMNPDILDKEGFTPLMRASQQGKLDVVKALLAAEAKPDLQSEDEGRYGFNALHCAAQAGHPAIITFLTTAPPAGPGMNPNTLNKMGYTPLMIASSQGTLVAVEALLAAGAKPALQAGDGYGYSALHCAAEGDHPDMIAFFTTDPEGPGMDPDILDKMGYTPLMRASAQGNLDTVKALLAAGAKPALQAENTSGYTALHCAAQEGHPNVITFLTIDPEGPGMKPDILDTSSLTPLMRAIGEGGLDAVKALVKAGANLAPRETNVLGYTALHWAAQEGHPAIITFLTTDPEGPGMDPDILDNVIECSPLVTAMHGKRPDAVKDVVKALVKAGAYKGIPYRPSPEVEPELQKQEEFKKVARTIVTFASRTGAMINYSTEEGEKVTCSIYRQIIRAYEANIEDLREILAQPRDKPLSDHLLAVSPAINLLSTAVSRNPESCFPNKQSIETIINAGRHR